MSEIVCARCKSKREGFNRPPFPGALGARVLEGICPQCWGDWLKQQTMLINHYGLDVMDPKARQFLTRNMDAFLFKVGDGTEVDTSQEGHVSW